MLIIIVLGESVIAATLFDLDVALRLTVAALSGVLALFSSVLSPVLVLWLLAAILVTQVVIELGGHERHTSPAPI